MMYDELIEELRRHHCDAKEDDTQEICEECAYDVIIADKSVPSGIASVCVCGLMNRAADAIENLDDICQHQVDEIRELKNQWIPVTERLPMIGEKAICFGKNGYMIGTYGEFGWMFPCYFGNVTHWIPLPKQPEEET